MDEKIPAWNLKDLYAGPLDTNINKDLDSLEKTAIKLETEYKGKIAGLTSQGLFELLKEYEKFEDSIAKLGAYVQLLFAENMQNQDHARLYQNTSERINDIWNHLLFMRLEINDLSEDNYQAKLTGDLLHFKPWLDDLRVFKPHQLTPDMELLLSEKSITGKQSWVRLFEDTLSGIGFQLDDQTLSCAEILNLMSSKDGETRKKAAKTFGTTLGNYSKTFALISNTLAKDKGIEDKWRKFKKPISSRNLANLVDDKIVDNLISTVKRNYAKLSHKYYEFKAKEFGVLSLNYWDRNAPYPADSDRKYSFEEAKEIVLGAYSDFSPKMTEIAKKFFDNNWIDAETRMGKESGAFSHPVAPSAHPYILMNFQGKARDVMTLAHELGHGVHQYLARKQGIMADTPLTLAETASVFGEMLTFRKLISLEPDAKKRRYFIAGKVEDMLNTVVRQIAFCEFETKFHDERASGELSVERISEIWLEVQKSSLGPAIQFEDEYKYYWAYISHFVHVPFYVYAYAFGDCLVNSLYRKYQETPEGFADKYLTMLSEGGSKRAKELLAPFGLDISEGDFWQKGLDMIEGLIAELG